MGINSQDEFRRGYKTLQSIRIIIDQIKDTKIRETIVREYHVALDRISGFGIDIDEFRIPGSKMSRWTFSEPDTPFGGALVSSVYEEEERYVDKIYFLIKIDTIINYLTGLNPEKPKRIGYNTHKE